MVPRLAHLTERQDHHLTHAKLWIRQTGEERLPRFCGALICQRQGGCAPHARLRVPEGRGEKPDARLSSIASALGAQIPHRIEPDRDLVAADVSLRRGESPGEWNHLEHDAKGSYQSRQRRTPLPSKNQNQGPDHPDTSRDEAPPSPSVDEAVESAEGDEPPEPLPALGTLIRRNLLRLALSLVLLGALAAAVVIQFREELDLITTFVFEHLGLGGVVLLIFITDAFISPLPPDTLLMLIAASDYAEHWPYLIPAIGVVSCIAGIAGYSGGRLLARRPLAKAILGPFHTQSQALVLRYGAWGVALGALTPIPFSITCWTAGLLEVPFGSVWPPCLLRVPRYVLYYAVIALGERAFGV